MPSKPATRRRSPVLTAIGLVLVLVGTVLLGYVAWQYFGTNVVSKREHDRIRTQIVEDWDKDSTPIEGVGLLRVPRFGDDFEVPILDGFDDATLAQGIGRYVDGVQPGEVGNLVLSGHRVTHGEPFRGFLNLQTGDEVIVETKIEVHTYVLRQNGDRTRVDFRTSWPLWPVPNPEASEEEPSEELVTLITCSELFHTADRSVVVGELVSSVPKKKS